MAKTKTVSLQDFISFATDTNNKIDMEYLHQVNSLYSGLSSNDRFYADLIKNYWAKHPIPIWN
jgi:hypothetical protein